MARFKPGQTLNPKTLNPKAKIQWALQNACSHLFYLSHYFPVIHGGGYPTGYHWKKKL